MNPVSKRYTTLALSGKRVKDSANTLWNNFKNNPIHNKILKHSSSNSHGGSVATAESHIDYIMDEDGMYEISLEDNSIANEYSGDKDAEKSIVYDNKTAIKDEETKIGEQELTNAEQDLTKVSKEKVSTNITEINDQEEEVDQEYNEEANEEENEDIDVEDFTYSEDEDSLEYCTPVQDQDIT